MNGQHGGRVCSIPQIYLTTKPFFFPKHLAGRRPAGRPSESAALSYRWPLMAVAPVVGGGWGVSPGMALQHGGARPSTQQSRRRRDRTRLGPAPATLVLASLLQGRSKARLSHEPPATLRGHSQPPRRSRDARHYWPHWLHRPPGRPGQGRQPPTEMGAVRLRVRRRHPAAPASSARPSRVLEPQVGAHQAEMSIWQVLEDIQTSSTRRNWK